MSKAKEAVRRFIETMDKGGKVEWARKTKFIPQRDGSLRRLVTHKDGAVKKDVFLSLEGSLKDVDIERSIQDLRRKWKK
jgi:hypothetical protein